MVHRSGRASMTEYGYAGDILKIDLNKRDVAKLTTAHYADRFLGGRGIAAKIYWDIVPPQTKALDPENCLIYITGPLAGFTRFAGCRWQICGKSPEMEPEAFSYANLGGSWGAWLKFTGYDGIVITGMADQPVYLYVDSTGKVEIRDASDLWGKTTTATQEILQARLGKEVRVVGIGPAAENLVSFSSVLATDNASGGSGFGCVMGSKKLKAIVLKADEKKSPIAAAPEKLQSLAKQVYELQTRNHEDMHQETIFGRNTACYGCVAGCTRRTYEAEDGKKFKCFCMAQLVYREQAMKYYGDGVEVARLATRLCDEYGLDAAVMRPLIIWLNHCYQAGILGDEETGLPLSKMGSSDFIKKLVRKISLREGFGDILARGTIKAAEYVGRGSQKFIADSLIATKGSETNDYDPRLILPNAIIYATEPRRAIHMLHAIAQPLRRWNNWQKGTEGADLSTEILQDIAEKWWGRADACDFSTYEGKAITAKIIQDYGCVRESLILCDLVWPIYQTRSIDNNIRLATLESQIISAVTGRKINETELMKMGERIFNLQRAILLRQGWGGRKEIRSWISFIRSH